MGRANQQLRGPLFRPVRDLGRTGIQFPAQRPTVLPPQRILAERPAGRNRTVAPIGISVARRDGLLPARQRPQLDQRFAPFRNRTFVGGLPHHPRQVPRIQSVLERILRAPSSGTGSASRLPPRLVLLPARCAAPSARAQTSAPGRTPPAPSASANAGQPSRRSAGTSGSAAAAFEHRPAAAPRIPSAEPKIHLRT